jgi:hypothetical protein
MAASIFSALSAGQCGGSSEDATSHTAPALVLLPLLFPPLLPPLPALLSLLLHCRPHMYAPHFQETVAHALRHRRQSATLNMHIEGNYLVEETFQPLADWGECPALQSARCLSLPQFSDWASPITIPHGHRQPFPGRWDRGNVLRTAPSICPKFNRADKSNCPLLPFWPKLS